MKHILLTLWGMVAICPVFSQNSFELQSKYSPGEGMLIKVTPDNYAVFYEGLKNGYTVERSSDGGTFSVLTNALRPPVLDMQPNPQYDLTPTEIMVLRTWDRRDTVEMALADPEKTEGLNFGLGMYLASSLNSPKEARRSGLVFIDKTVVPGQRYIYRVSLGGQSINLRAVAQNSPAPPLPKIDGVGLDSTAAIRWPHNPSTAPFDAYLLEKSTDRQSYISVTETVILYNPNVSKGENNPLEPNTIYQKDKLTRNQRPYFYRLIGVDAFGDQTTATQVLEIIGKDMTPPAAPTDFSISKIESEGAVILKWEKPIREDDLAGFNIYRSDFPDSAFVQINPQILGAAQTTFSEKMPLPEEGKYYRIGAMDVARNESYSPSEFVVFNDKTPPAAPLGFQAKADSNGVVRLDWKANQEADFLGYLLVSSRFEDAEFIPVSQKPLRSTSFQDSLALDLQNHFCFYRLAAVDKQFNTSPFTPKIKVVLPDTIAPTAPLLKKVSLENGVPVLEWATGKESDLSAISIFRKEDEKRGWQEIAVVKEPSIVIWSDTTLTEGSVFSYRLQASDLLRNTSRFSNRKSIAFRQNDTVSPVYGFKYSAEKERLIRLDWQVPKGNQVVNFMVFKMENNGEPQLLDVAPETSFIDRKVKTGNAYSYFVVAQSESGKRSEPSEVLEVKF